MPPARPLVLTIAPDDPDQDTIARAAAVLRAGGLIGLPTETVYGLAALGDDPTALARIFAAKRRPADNPLILHIAAPDQLDRLAARMPVWADALMAAFWPGPLTLIVPARASVPNLVTAGTGRVAVRLPAHPVAFAVIQAAGRALAAPSANLSGRPSSTTAAHVVEDLGSAVALVLDAGPCPIGLESTVLDLSGTTPVLAREGGVPIAALEAVIGPVVRRTHVAPGESPVSPGQKYRHYAPKAPLHLIEGNREQRADKLAATIALWRRRGRRVAVLCCVENQAACAGADPVLVLGTEADPTQSARALFAALRRADALAADVILAEALPEIGIGLAANERLRRAASAVI